MKRARLCLAIVLAAVVPACGFAEVDAPISFRTDRRLSIVSPDDDSDVALPVTVRWEASDFDLDGGNQFGVFLDRAPLGQRKQLRVRLCTESEARPVAPGEDRKPCEDERDEVFTTTDTSFTFECLTSREGAPKRTRDRHEVTVILLDAEYRRVGKAADSVSFEVDPAAARRCRGL